MNEYPKINTVYKRDPTGHLMVGQFSHPAFDYLRRNLWLCHEKVDGMNIRVIWQGGVVSFRGRTDAAQLPPLLVARLTELFPASAFATTFEPPTTGVCLYGEGYGARIQKGGGNYKADGVDFVLFDVWVDGWWLDREAIVDVAARLGSIQFVPTMWAGSLDDAIGLTRRGITSTWGSFQAEGLVMRPAVSLFDRRGHRIITKIKTRDFERTVSVVPES